MPDTLSDVNGARVGLGGIPVKTPAQVRTAQLVTVSLVTGDPRQAINDAEKLAQVRQALEALGIFTKTGQIQTRPGRRPVGIAQLGKRPGKREPSGRLSRAAKKVRM
jgi:hypothetical protein